MSNLTKARLLYLSFLGVNTTYWVYAFVSCVDDFRFATALMGIGMTVVLHVFLHAACQVAKDRDRGTQ